MEIPLVSIGIMTENALSFVFNNEYVHKETGDFLTGEHRALLLNNKILFNGKLYEELYFEPSSPNATFELKEVTIGKEFHWERKEDQHFGGALELLVTEKGILAINIADVEGYLISVISSEMSATSAKELLKAHAVISRSWLLAQTEKRNKLITTKEVYHSCYQDKERLIRWYDRQDHDMYDVCADDHCQRYQGVTRASTPFVEEAIKETRGEILIFENEICDTRFSKCCGGITEVFENTWEPVHHAYLTAHRDSLTNINIPDLTKEEEAEKWIRSSPASFCNTNKKEVLEQVLNNYDQETSDFFRWQVEYSQAEISELLERKSGFDFGLILDLIPVKRGASGRIEELKVIGSNLTLIIGKELEIRSALSESHLYSSAFIVDRLDIKGNIPGRFILTGAGWGHGVGLCQIGAAVMSTQGYNYQQILSHYYKGATIIKRYS